MPPRTTLRARLCSSRLTRETARPDRRRRGCDEAAGAPPPGFCILDCVSASIGGTLLLSGQSRASVRVRLGQPNVGPSMSTLDCYRPPFALTLTLQHRHCEPPLRRGNPGAARTAPAVPGLPRRCAPRNDGTSRAKRGWYDTPALMDSKRSAENGRGSESAIFGSHGRTKTAGL